MLVALWVPVVYFLYTLGRFLLVLFSLMYSPLLIKKKKTKKKENEKERKKKKALHRLIFQSLNILHKVLTNQTNFFFLLNLIMTIKSKRPKKP